MTVCGFLFFMFVAFLLLTFTILINSRCFVCTSLTELVVLGSYCLMKGDLCKFFLLWLYLLYVMQFIHLKSFCGDVHSLSL